LIDAWYPGMQGGNAVADVLFGYYNPAGRTAVTWYNDVSQLPGMASMNLYDKNGRTYRFFKGNLLFPFGYGLSYTTFAYSNLTLSSQQLDPCSLIGGRVTVTNTGNRDGDEVVQIYLKTLDSTVPAPNVRLVAFERIHLRVGELAVVPFTILPEQHSVVYDSSDIYYGQVMIEEGRLVISAGGGQPDYYPGYVAAEVRITSSTPLRLC